MHKSIRHQRFRIDSIMSMSFLFFALFIYPLINRVYDGQSGILVAASKLVWTFIIPLILIFLLRRQSTSTDIVDKLFILMGLYLTFSLLAFSIFNPMNPSDFFKEISYSILPILCFFVFKGNSGIPVVKTYNLIVFICITVILIGFWSILDIPKPEFVEKVKNVKNLNFQSFYSPIVLASMAPICVGALLFDRTSVTGSYKFLLIVLFIIASIMTLQRAAAVGLILCFCIYAFQYIRSAKFFVGAMIFFAIGTAMINSFSHLYSATSFFDMLLSELEGFNLDQVLYERREQSFIFNDNSPISILFGEGFGKYSPQNQLSALIMPDASYVRLFNELGAVGLIIFFSPFVVLVLKSLKKAHLFDIFLITFVLVHFYFNRILMSLPTAYFIYAMLGLGSNPLLLELGRQSDLRNGKILVN